MNLNKEQQVIVSAVKEVGEMLKDKFANFDRSQIKMKSAHELVTEYDILSEKVILSAIKSNFPDHEIISEEEGGNEKTSDWLWVVDPIDGTTNFTMHNPVWCISVGLFYKKEIVLGIIYAPMLDEFYLAVKGEGVTLNGEKVVVSAIETGKVLNAFCHGYDEVSIKKALAYVVYQKLNGFDCRQLGSAALELAFVAGGRLESVTIPGANTWDVAAGILMVREAGGKVTDFVNEEWNIDSPDMIASNDLVHGQILEALKNS